MFFYFLCTSGLCLAWCLFFMELSRRQGDHATANVFFWMSALAAIFVGITLALSYL